MKRALLAFAAAIAASLSAAPAHANGRFPESNAFFFSPTDPDLVLMRVTFGMLISRDRGKSWDWICERAVGTAGVEDPMFAITPDSTLLGSTFQGLVSSRDRGCSFDFYRGDLNDLVFIDLASRPAAPEQVIAFASSYDGQLPDGGVFFKSTLFETKDEGKTFAALPGQIAPGMLGETVDVAPSDPDRFYVSTVREPGQLTRSAHVLTSRDHGKVFEENTVELVDTEKAVFIAAVDPENADRVYLRTSNAPDKPSRLLVTDDAGKTYRTIFTGQGALAGFALAPDGKRVWVGGPRDGLHVASTTDYAFQKRSQAEIQCLAIQSDGLWACSTEKSGFVGGLSKDDGATFEAKLHFCEIRGPLVCPADTLTHVECVLGGTDTKRVPPWPPQRSTMGCDPPPPDAGDAGDAAPPQIVLEAGGGGCAVPAPASASPIAAAVAGAAAIAALRRRRRR